MKPASTQNDLQNQDIAEESSQVPQVPHNSLSENLEIERQRSLEYLEGWKRAKADYANLEARLSKRLMEVSEKERADVILEILPVYETLVASLEHVEEGEAKIGLEASVNQFWKSLQGLGVEKISAEGRVNPDLHEVLLQQKKEGAESGEIIQEAAAGYTLDGKLMKPAKVIVAE